VCVCVLLFVCVCVCVCVWVCVGVVVVGGGGVVVVVVVATLQPLRIIKSTGAHTGVSPPVSVSNGPVPCGCVVI
jgi:hypothetical protein